MKKNYILLLPSLLLGLASTATAMEVEIGNPSVTIDSSKILTTIGEGSKTCNLVTTWNDDKGVDHLAFSLKFNENDNLTPSSVLDKIFGEDGDWRFYTDESGAYCFDLNGDKVRTGEPVQYDHCQKDGVTGEWVVTAPNETIEDGDLLTIEFRKDSASQEVTTIIPFYLPAAETSGVWFVPDQEFALADATYSLPLYINLAGGTYSSLSVTYYADENYSTRNSNVCTVALAASLGKAGSSTATLTTKGEGTVYVALRLYRTPEGESKSSYTDYSYTPLTITPPVKVIEGISLNLPEVLQLSHSYELTDYITLIPEDATYTGGYTVKLDSSEPKSIAGVSGTKLSTRTTPGHIAISVTSKKFTSISAIAEADIQLVNPVTNIEFINIDPSQPLEIEFDPYKMEYNNTCALFKVEPADADISKLQMKILGTDIDSEDGKVDFQMGTYNGFNSYHTDLLTTYQQNDGAYDIMAWGYGTAKVVFEATDGSGAQSPELTIISVPRHLDIPDDFQNGTFWLNEEWFGHTNGSINYIDEDLNLHYRVYNYNNQNEETPRENNSFGCTSQYGMIFGDRLYVMSKQNHDGGDNYLKGGGRLVIADAKTLKRLHSFDVIGEDETRGGDGRACVGVSSDKVYIGHHAGIRVLNIDNSAATPEEMFKLGKELTFSDATGDLTPGNPQGALYSNQVGDMVYSSGHVFAVMQDRGLLVIDTETDTHKTTLGDGFVQAVTQSADGNIWYARNNTVTGVVTLHCVDPETLEDLGEYALPETAGTINTGWGAWRSANFFASKTNNILF